MKIVLKCPECFGKDFEVSFYGSYVKCKECGKEIFIKDSDFEFSYESERSNCNEHTGK